jgi:hypothetical protein
MTTKTENKEYLSFIEFHEYNNYNDGGYLQYVLGLESCKTRGEVVEILKEIYKHGTKTERKKICNIILGRLTSIQFRSSGMIEMDRNIYKLQKEIEKWENE